jgi:hypothetical protein
MSFSDVFGPVTTRTQVISDFDTYILSNNPYAQVQPDAVSWGILEFDGPLAPGISGSKPAMQWYFGGVPYAITKAVRVYFSYVRTWDGSGATINDSILIGFQQDLSTYVYAQPIPYVQNYSQWAVGPTPFAGSQLLASDAAILASEASVITTAAAGGNAAAAQAALQQANTHATSASNHLAQAAPSPSKASLSLITASAQAAVVHLALALSHATQLGSFNGLIERELQGDLAGAFPQLLGNPLPVDFDGPAQDSDSARVFPYTAQTLINDPDKYSRVLFWYFGGKPYRVTKAMRIPLNVPAVTGANVFNSTGHKNHASYSRARASAAMFIGYLGDNPGGG